MAKKAKKMKKGKKLASTKNLVDRASPLFIKN
jgi:hypothetical protein